MKFKIDLEKLELHDGGVHLILFAKMNRKTVRLVLDTGASRTVMDSNRHERWQNGAHVQEIEHKSAGLGTDSMESSLTKIKNFKLGDLKLIDFEVVLLNLAHVNSSYGQIGIKPVDGILGGDILNKYLAQIDYKKSKLILNIKE